MTENPVPYDDTQKTDGIEMGSTVQSKIRREDFAPGRLGEMSYQVVLSGEPCVTYVDDQKNRCGRPPATTVDIDIRGQVELFPACEDHPGLLIKQLEEEIYGIGSSSFPSQNGSGRGYDREEKTTTSPAQET
jgi:hypothetical protein